MYDGLPDYSSFYDIALLSGIMDGLYPEEDDSTAYDIILALMIAAIIVGALLLRNRNRGRYRTVKAQRRQARK